MAMPRAALLFLLLAGLVATTNASAEDERYPGLERFAGHFVWVGGDAEQEARLDAIEVVVAKMTRVLRGAARRRLRNGTHISAIYDIEVNDDIVTIGIDDGRAWTTDLEGTPAKYEHEGEAMTMSRWWVDGSIHAVGEQKVGSGTYDFRLSDDGQTLNVRFSMNSGLMPEPVVFDTTYRRIEP